MHTHTPAAALFVSLAAVASADATGLHVDLSESLAHASTAMVNQDDGAMSEPKTIRDAASASLFWEAGTEWLTFGSGFAYDTGSEYDFNVHGAYSRFLGDELEFAMEVGLWYFDQVGQNTAGVNWNMVFRWHFLHPEDDDTWTIYADAGIGLLLGFDNVPDGGTGFNFTPRAGVGGTYRLNDHGTRLQGGVRWHHISNGRIEGNARNPSRDSIMVYAGVMIPY